MSNRFTRAVARLPARTFADGLTTATLGAPDFQAALRQHADYCEALRNAGVDVTVLPADDAYPDSTFVEDTAVVTEGRAIVTRPGAESRLEECAAIERALAPFFDRLDRITAPGTIDGGDVCEADGRVYIGLSHRTNRSGAQQLAAWLDAAGSTATIVDIRDVDGILHLKSGLAYVGDDTFVVIPALADRLEIDGEIVVTEPAENYGANCVRVNDALLLPSGHPSLQRRLTALGFDVVELDVSEYRKMDGGLSCLSIRF